MKFGLLLIMLFFGLNIYSQNTIDIMVKGISDNKKDGAQKDRLEAIMDAKRQACEKAGLKIESKTTVKNFQTVFDFIESQAEAVLLPGFQVMDIGYQKDGTYQVVLSGKLSSSNDTQKEVTKFTIFIGINEDNINKNYILKRLNKVLNENYPIVIDNELIQIYESTVSIKYRCSGKNSSTCIVGVTYEIPAALIEISMVQRTRVGYTEKKIATKLLETNKEYYVICGVNYAGYYPYMWDLEVIEDKGYITLDSKKIGSSGYRVTYPDDLEQLDINKIK